MKRLICLFVLVWLAATASADELPYRRYRVSDGLPNEDVHALTQAADGRLYVGTPGGLAVYNGRTFRQVSIPDSLGAAGVYQLVADGSSVWAGLANGFVVEIQSGRIRRALTKVPGLERLLVRRDTLHMVGSRSYWILPPQADQPRRESIKMSFRLPGKGRLKRAGAGLADADFGPNGNLWVLDHRFGPGRLRSDGSVDFADVPRGDALTGWWNHLRFGPEGTAFLQGRSRVYRYSTATGDLNTLSSVKRSAGFYFDRGRVYVPSRTGVARLARSDHDHSLRALPPLNETLGLPHARARCVLRDHEGGLWIGTRGGLLYLFAPDVRHISRVDGTNLVYADHVTRDAENTLWVNTWGSGIVRLRPQRSRFTPGGATQWMTVRSRDGHMYGLSERGWFRREPSEGWKRLGPASGAVRGVVDSTGTGYFWHNRGLYRHDPNAAGSPNRLFSWKASNNGLHAHTLAPNGDAILYAKGTLLRGTPTNPARPLMRYDTLAALPRHTDAQIRFMAFDSYGTAWLPFRHQGLVRVPTAGDTARVERVLPGRPITNVTLSGDSLAFAAAQTGLYVLDQQVGRLRRHLTSADGLLATSTSSAAIYGDTLYATHPQGVTALPVPELFDTPPPPNAMLTHVEQAFEKRPPTSSLTFAAEERTVGFGFAAATFQNPQNVVYEYRLWPRDTTWSVTTKGFTRYVDLAPGRYQFEVRARRTKGPHGEKASISFTIPQYFYETHWFQVLLLLLLGVLGVGAYRWRVRALRQRQRKLEKTVVDRTEKLRREKRTTEEQAERLAELDAAKNRFFANLSHEFRTPLMLILDPLRDVLDGDFGDVPTAVRDQLRLMRRNARRLEHLIEQLLDLTRLDAGRMELDRRTVDLVAFTRELVQAFTPLAERERVDLHFQADVDRLRASFDPDKIEQVLSNLLANALEYTPEGGKVWVAVAIDRSDASRVAEIVVKDTGPGLTEQELRRIFDRFEQARGGEDSEDGGLGLGLALASELVDLHDGTLRAESEPGFGTAFTVRLPLGTVDPLVDGEGEAAAYDFAPAADESESLTVSTGHVPDGDGSGGPRTDTGRAEDKKSEQRSPTLLIVEDNADMRAHLRRHLAAEYNVLEAEHGAAALEMAREHEPDLVVSDVMMPTMSGTELCEAIKADETLQATPVVLLTAKAASTDAVEGLEHGADDYLTKPFDIDELRARIERLLTTRRELRDRFTETLQVEPGGTTISEEDAPFLEAVLSVLEEHLGDSEFRVDDLAAEMALSRRQLTRRVKETTGETPAALMRRLRLQRAAKLLKQDERTVSEIAYAVGYTSSSHFAKLFRKQFGCLPSEYEGA